MVNKTDNPSEHAVEDDDDKFAITGRRDIVYILRDIMDKGEMVSAHFNRGESFFLTAIVDIDADEGEVYLDYGANEALNRKILDSDKIIFVTAQNKVKVQFVTHWVEKTKSGGRDAFKTELPRVLHKFQNREFYRVDTPIVRPLKCVVVTEDNRKIELIVADISIGGVGVILPPADDVRIERGMMFDGCHLALPEIGNIVASLEIRSVFDVTLRNDQKSKRAGCRFIGLPANMQSMIQRYLIKVERERRAMQADR